METITNLAKAFVGESQARNRYTLYGKIAVKEGYHQTAEIFFKTAEQEHQHAKWLMKMINELKSKGEKIDPLIIESEVPTTMGSTEENLKSAILGENFEHSSMYPKYSKTAEKEGLPLIAGRLLAIAKAEEHHEDRYKRLLKVIQEKTVWNKENKVYWVCMKCGYIHEGKTPPEICPSCNHSKKYFTVQNENY